MNGPSGQRAGRMSWTSEIGSRGGSTGCAAVKPWQTPESARESDCSISLRREVQPIGTIRGRPGRCACAVRAVGYFGHVLPDGAGDRSNDCVPIRRTAQILTQSKNSDNELKQTVFPTEKAGLRSKSAVFAPWTSSPPVVGRFSGWGREG